MKKHLFLTGPSGCGKTFLIRKVLGDKAAFAGGFVTERITDTDGSLLGYDLFPAAHAALTGDIDGKRFLDYTQSPPLHDNSVFREYAASLLNESLYYPFIMLDEIGGYEILIPQFREQLSAVLCSDVPCIGVLKGQINAEELKNRLGLGDKFPAMLTQLRSFMEHDEDTLLYEFTDRGDREAEALISQWVNEYADI